MPKKEKINVKESKYWFWCGLALFLIASLGSGIGTFDKNYFWDSIYGIVDWLAASIIYFFYGAIIGHMVDLYVDKKNDVKTKLPSWFYPTILFVIIGIIAIAIKLKSFTIQDLWFYIYFPFHYGPFFPGYAYSLLPGKLFNVPYIAKLTLDLILLALFFSWINLKLKVVNNLASIKQKKTEKLILVIIFLVMTIGMIKCASMIS